MKLIARIAVAAALYAGPVHAISFGLEGTGTTVRILANAAYEELHVVSNQIPGMCGVNEGTAQVWFEYERQGPGIGNAWSPRVPGLKDTDVHDAYNLMFNKWDTWTLSSPVSDVKSILRVYMNGCKSGLTLDARIDAYLNCSAGECWEDRPACSISGPGVLPLGRVAAGDNTQGTAYIAIQCSHPVTGRIRATGTGGTDQLVYSGDGLTGQVTVGGRPGSEGMLIEGGETATEAALGVATQASSAAAGGAREAAIVVEFTAE